MGYSVGQARPGDFGVTITDRTPEDGGVTGHMIWFHAPAHTDHQSAPPHPISDSRSQRVAVIRQVNAASGQTLLGNYWICRDALTGSPTPGFGGLTDAGIGSSSLYGPTTSGAGKVEAWGASAMVAEVGSPPIQVGGMTATWSVSGATACEVQGLTIWGEQDEAYPTTGAGSRTGEVTPHGASRLYGAEDSGSAHLGTTLSEIYDRLAWCLRPQVWAAPWYHEE